MNEVSGGVSVLAPESFGVDERACELLRGLPDSAQSDIIDRLCAGMADGSIKNPSGFVVSHVLKYSPNVEVIKQEMLGLGVDDRAMELFLALPSVTQQELLSQLKEHSASNGVHNPSAWVAKAALNAKAKAIAAGGSAAFGTFPANHSMQSHTMNGAGMMWPTMAMGSQPAAMQQMSSPIRRTGYSVSAPAACGWGTGAVTSGANGGASLLTPEMFNVDERATQKLYTLPAGVQQELLFRLRDGVANGSIKNPSGFVVAAALKVEANTAVPDPHKPLDGDALGIDAEAMSLVQGLPTMVQQDLFRQLLDAITAGNVTNPSAWLVKAALNTKRGLQAPQQSQGVKNSPAIQVARQMGVDDRAIDMLQRLGELKQTEIVELLQDGLQKGNITNPSGFTVKKVLAALQEARLLAASGSGMPALEMPAMSSMSSLPNMPSLPSLPSPASVTPLGQMGVDQRAQDLLSSIPLPVQQEICQLLQDGLSNGSVRNPSGFVVKKVLNAKQAGGLNDFVGGAARAAPY